MERMCEKKMVGGLDAGEWRMSRGFVMNCMLLNVVAMDHFLKK